jgi:phenylglyoxylate dehydrogenase epsilon subunit
VQRKHFIIGAGPAALSALEAIRRSTSQDEVKLVTLEDCLPYSPAALPYLLRGEITEAQLWLRDEAYFRDQRCTLVRGKEVTGLLPEKKEVVYNDGVSESYDTLLIASGAEPARPAIEGMEDVGAQHFRTLTDCRRLLAELKTKNRVAILGAGLVGMKIATALLERGCQVSIIEKEQAVLPLYFSEEAEVYIRESFIDHKAGLFMGKAVRSVEREGEEIKIFLSDGGSLTADILINATGVKSRIPFLHGTGLRIVSGILVDKRMGTSIDQIYAAGDVAETPDFFTGEPKISAVIPSAVSQGRVAGANMAGLKAEYEGGIPMTAFDFMSNQAFSIGAPMLQQDPGQVLKQKDGQKKRFKKLVFDGDRLIGGMFLNEKVDPGIILHIIRERINLAPHKEALFEGTRPLSDPWLSSLKFSRRNSR